mmetsp:Transcript_42143/g.88148  ORF Transcript_42143/g.88148 Transcript_42143/m.88148 type:complete len:96 (+) Transcript_42143:161-448(+)
MRGFCGRASAGAVCVPPTTLFIAVAAPDVHTRTGIIEQSAVHWEKRLQASAEIFPQRCKATHAFKLLWMEFAHRFEAYQRIRPPQHLGQELLWPS